MARPPRVYMERFFLARRELVEALAEKGRLEDVKIEVIKRATLLSPMVATCGPAGPNAAPLMVSFLVRDEYLEEAIAALKEIQKKYMGKGPEAYKAATRFLLDYVYNPEKVDPLRLASHLMTRGHTWKNIMATERATLGLLFPPDEGALELRARARIFEEGPIYEYVNMVHDLMHVVPHGKRSHPWYPAVVFEVEEIYDNDFHLLGLRIYPPPTIVVSAARDGRVYPGHFGDAELYVFYRLEDDVCRRVGIRENPYRGEHEHHGHHEHGHGGKRERILELIGDVQAVVTAAMGPGGREFFEERGVKVYTARPGTPLKAALPEILCRGGVVEG